MKLPQHRILEIFTALQSLGSRNPQGFAQFNLGVKAQYAVAKNLRKLSSVIDTFEKVKSDFAKDCGGTMEKTPQGMAWNLSDEQQVVFTEKVNELMSVEVEIELHQFDYAALGEEQGKIPSSLIAALLEDVITDDPV